MLSRHAKAHGFSMIAVVGPLLIIGLLMLTALHLSQDHLRRATLAADRAVALREAESALTAAECEIAIATDTPYRSEDCRAAPDAARIAALNPVTLSGFAPGACGEGAARGCAGLCRVSPPLRSRNWLEATLTRSRSRRAMPSRGGRHSPPAT